MLYAIIVGALAGWLAGKFMNSPGGLLRNILLGIVGSAVGDFLFGLIGFSAYGLFANILVSAIGACVCIWLSRKLF